MCSVPRAISQKLAVENWSKKELCMPGCDLSINAVHVREK